MNKLVRWETDQGPIVVEVDSAEPGWQTISRDQQGKDIPEVKEKFEDALENVRNAAESALRTFRDKTLNPDDVEIEFGVKLNVAAGAILAKTSTEGHLTVKLKWSRNADR